MPLAVLFQSARGPSEGSAVARRRLQLLAARDLEHEHGGRAVRHDGTRPVAKAAHENEGHLHLPLARGPADRFEHGIDIRGGASDEERGVLGSQEASDRSEHRESVAARTERVADGVRVGAMGDGYDESIHEASQCTIRPRWGGGRNAGA